MYSFLPCKNLLPNNHRVVECYKTQRQKSPHLVTMQLKLSDGRVIRWRIKGDRGSPKPGIYSPHHRRRSFRTRRSMLRKELDHRVLSTTIKIKNNSYNK